MSDGFTDLIDASNAFFTDLALNNRKDWFTPRKDHYQAEIKKPAMLLGDILAEDLSRVTGVSHTAKLFRIHRDVRFSKDKTPYNAHLHLMFSSSLAGKPVWFFGSSPDYLILGMGVMGLQGDGLTRYRAFVDRHGDDLTDAIQTARNTVSATISDWGPTPLKRVPKPYDADHPHADLLKRKALAITAPFPPDWRDIGVLATTARLTSAVLPIWRLLQDELE